MCTCVYGGEGHGSMEPGKPGLMEGSGGKLQKGAVVLGPHVGDEKLQLRPCCWSVASPLQGFTRCRLSDLGQVT